jgi:hypothetical protein
MCICTTFIHTKQKPQAHSIWNEATVVCVWFIGCNIGHFSLASCPSSPLLCATMLSIHSFQKASRTAQQPYLGENYSVDGVPLLFQSKFATRHCSCEKNDNPYSYWSLASPCSNVSNISQNSLEIRVVPLVRSNCCRLLHSLRWFKISEVKTEYSACIDKTSENRL